MADQVLKFILLGEDRTSKAWKSAGSGMDILSKKSQDVGKKLSLGVTLPLAGIAAVGIKTAAEFDSTMGVMQANLGASSDQMEKLRKTAMDMGAKTVYSAGEAAGAMLDLSKAGLNTEQIMGGGVQAAMALAAVEGMNLSDAANTAANAMNMFGLQAKDLPAVADALAGASVASTASVESLALALSQVGPGARSAGLTLNDTVGVLAAFEQAGIKGSDAGTSLKTMLTRLVPSTDKAASAMEDYGLVVYDGTNALENLAARGIKPVSDKFEDVDKAIETYVEKTLKIAPTTAAFGKAVHKVYVEAGLLQNAFIDNNGEFKSMTEIAGILKDKLGGLSAEQKTQAMATIFGSDATRAATILMNEGSDGLARYIKATEQRGKAEELANARMSGMAGAIEQARGSMETAALTIGESLSPEVVGLSNAVAGAANWFSNLDDGTRKTIVGLGAVAAAIGPVTYGFGKTIDMVRGAQDGLAAMGRFGRTAKTNLSAFAGTTVLAAKSAGGLGGGLKAVMTAAGGAIGPIGGVVLGVGALVAASQAYERTHLDQKMSDLTKRLDEAQIAGKFIADEIWPGGFEAMVRAIDKGSYSLSQLAPQFRDLDLQLVKSSPEKAAEEYDKLAEQAEAAGWSVEQLADVLPEYAAKLRESSLANKEAEESEKGKEDAIRDATSAALGAIDANLALAGSLDDLAGMHDNLADHVENMREQYGKNATALGSSTKAGRENQKYIRDQIGLIKANASAEAQNAATVEEGHYKSRKALIAGKKALVDQLVQFGFSRKGAKAYVDQLLDIPPETETDIKADKTDAEAKIAKIKARLKDKDLTDPEKTKLKADLTKLEAAVEEAKRKLGEVKDKTVKIKLTATVEHGRVYYKDGSGRKKPLDVLFPGGGMGGTGAGLMALTAGKGAPGARWNARGPMWSWHRGPDGQGHHNGVDIVAPGGTPVFTTRGGTIVHRGFGGSEGSWAGNNVVERLSNGVKLVFAHLSKSIASGSVSAGGRIGSVGSTGNSSGNHLHVSAIKGGTYVNPVPYLATGGILKARPGGVPFVGAEAGYDEAVIPLPPNWRNGGAIAQPQPPIVVQLQADGRTIQEIVVRHEQRTGRYVLSNQRSA